MSNAAGGALSTGEGRLRLGWRQLGFTVLFVLVGLTLAVILPQGLLWTSAATLVAALIAGWALLALDGRSPGALGFHVGRTSLSETAKGVGLGVALGLAVVGAIALLGGATWAAQPGTLGGWLSGAVGAMLFFAIPAAAEEALLRGYPLQALAEAWGAGIALLVTSIVFGALHVANPGATALGLANVVAAGVLLGVVYLKTASLWWATGAHLGWNWSHGYLADVPVSGHELVDAPFYEGVPRGAEWLGGGAFGPEGSAVTTGLLLLGAAALWRLDGLGPSRDALRTKPLWSQEEAGAPASGRQGTRQDRDGVA